MMALELDRKEEFKEIMKSQNRQDLVTVKSGGLRRNGLTSQWSWEEGATRCCWQKRGPGPRFPVKASGRRGLAECIQSSFLFTDRGEEASTHTKSPYWHVFLPLGKVKFKILLKLQEHTLIDNALYCPVGLLATIILAPKNIAIILYLPLLSFFSSKYFYLYDDIF